MKLTEVGYSRTVFIFSTVILTSIATLSPGCAFFLWFQTGSKSHGHVNISIVDLFVTNNLNKFIGT